MGFEESTMGSETAASENVVEATLANLVRKGFGDRKDEQVRLEVCSFNGKRYVSMRVWWQTEGGEWAPSKKGMSVRLGELGQIITALHKAEDFCFKAQQGAPVPIPAPTLPGIEPAAAYRHPPSGKPMKPRRPEPTLQADGSLADEDVF